MPIDSAVDAFGGVDSNSNSNNDDDDHRREPEAASQLRGPSRKQPQPLRALSLSGDDALLPVRLDQQDVIYRVESLHVWEGSDEQHQDEDAGDDEDGAADGKERNNKDSKNGCDSSSGLPADLAPAPGSKEVNLLLSVETAESNGSTAEAATGCRFRNQTILAFPQETIRHLRLRLHNRGLFTSRHCLVFGDRQLLEHETVGQVAASSDGDLHVFARLSDVSSLEVRTQNRQLVLKDGNGIRRQQQQQQQQRAARQRSALTERLAMEWHEKDEEDEEDSMMLRGRVVEIDEALSELVDRSAPVVHLVIRRTSGVHWHHLRDDWFEISISALDTVDTVKRKIEEVEGIATDMYRFLCAGELLAPGKPLASYGIKKGSVLELIPVEKPGNEAYPDGSPRLSSPKHKLFEHWKKARDALAQGVPPKLAPAGTGGSYFIYSNAGTKVAVFKPQDEEPRAPNNPKGHVGSPDGNGLRRGVRPGEGATREVIAYLLDHGHFSGVPPTAMVTLKGMEDGAKKIGSLQQFIPHDTDCEEMGPSAFPVHEVHKIGVLDIRLANADRNGGNILARRRSADGRWELTPIDHGYCLPSSFEDINFEWLYWPQAKVPFSQETLEHIEALDAEQDLEILSGHGLSLRSACERVLRVCTMLLKKAALKGWTLYQIGNAISRQTLQRSPLEKMHKRATQLAIQEEYGEQPVGAQATLLCSSDVYLKHMESVVDQFLSELPVEDPLI